MLFSFALIFIIGFTLSGMFNKIKLPGILGMLLTGIILGPFTFNLISKQVLDVSSELRQIALIIILARAGLSLNVEDLKRVGRPAISMCFVPATFELLSVIIFAPIIFNVSHIEAAIMGTVLAAVSPAVVVPRMLKVMESGYGKQKSIPQLILAGASVDDIFVIVLFSSFMQMYEGSNFNFVSLLSIPISIILGFLVGMITGILLDFTFRKINTRDTLKVIIFLSASFLLVSLETAIKSVVPISGLLAVMSLGITIFKRDKVIAKRLSNKFSKLWVGAEVLLFVLVGAAVDIRIISDAGAIVIIFISLSLVFRIIGVIVSLLKTKLNKKEKIFCMISYLPKATVQAAIGSIPLSRGVESGSLIFTVAVLAIVITAPLGAIGIDLSYKKLLNKD